MSHRSALPSEAFFGGAGVRGIAKRATSSLRHRDFRLLWCGAGASSVGTWMQAVAENWLILSLTGSALFLGLDAFLQQVPVLLFTLVGGAIADRRDRRRMLVVSQYVQLSAALVLAGLVSTGHVLVWHILALSFCSGCAQAFGGPAYLALTPSLVSADDMSNAMALNSLQFNIARFLGPLLAGATMMTFKAAGLADTSALATCFALNGLSFIVVIVALTSLHVGRIGRVQSGGMLHELRNGLTFVGRRHGLLAVVVMSGVIAVAGYPALTLLPVFAGSLTAPGIEGYSVLMVCAGAGAIVGTLVAAWLGTASQMVRTTLGGIGLLGLCIVAFAASRVPWLSYTLLFLVGAGLMLASCTLTSLAQSMVPDDMRGRVMGVYLVASRGGAPVGSLVGGYLATLTSASRVLSVGGMILFVTSVASLAWDRQRRPLRG